MVKRKIAADEEDQAGPTSQEMEAARRILHDALKFWRVCTEKACKRDRGCRGDVDACWRRYSPAVPDELMMRLRAAISARAAGLSIPDSVRAADQHVAAVNAALARLAERQAQHEPNARPVAAPVADTSQSLRATAKPSRVRVV